MARARSADTVILGHRREQRLHALVDRPTTAQRLVLRARIVLLAWRHWSNAAIARELGITENTVRKWRHRFVTLGMPGLDDAPRPGRRPRYDVNAQLRLVATVTETPPAVDSHWSHRLLAEHLHDTLGISSSQIGRILCSLDVKPHRVRGWLNRKPDPEFLSRAQAVCQLYLTPCPEDTVLFSVDEKTAIQATSRKHRTRGVRRGRPELREFEYVRHGTASLIAALNITDGTVHPTIIDKNDSTTFIAFLTELADTVEDTKKIHIILDNGSSHTSKQTKAWLAEHPRITVTYTPAHASWLNMVELFFSILTRRMLRRGDFASRQDLIDKILTFIDTYNHTAKPFRWTYDAKLLRAA